MRLCCGIFLVLSSFLSANQDECKEFVKSELPAIIGWCSPKKAEAMMNLIFETSPAVCVELGVFGGSSLFPIACALKYLNQGVVYGIDAWDCEEAIRYYPKESPHWIWWSQQDMEACYNQCIELIERHELEPFCLLFKDPFAAALHVIPSIDILHIDATHTNEGDAVDVIPFIQKVRKMGYIWFDGWANSSDTYEYLKQRCNIKKVVDSGNCILLQKTTEN